MEVDGPPEQESRPEQEEVVSDLGGETESLAESSEGVAGPSMIENSADVVKFKLLSPMGGKSIEFQLLKGQANRDIQEELMLHLTNIFKLGLGIKEAFEKAQNAEWQELPWSDSERCPEIVHKLNRCITSVVSLWRGASRPKTDCEWFQTPFCTSEQCKKLSFTIFNRVVKNAQVLNKCYKSFSSLTYGETSFDQIQIILDRLQMTEKDVFVDLGSGVGHVVTYAAAYTLAKKCVGIEINDVPAVMAANMKKEFENMMSWYGKKYRPFDLIHGDFLKQEHKKLITEEATVIYINNFAFDPNLMFSIKQLIMEMPNGTRIICTKSLSEEREDKVMGENGEMNQKRIRPISSRARNRQTVDMMLDVDELPLAEAPVSWSTGKGVQFLLFTVNHCKIEQMFEKTNNTNSSNSTRSGSAESIAVATEDTIDRSIAATIDEVVSARPPAARASNRYPEEDDDDDDEDYQAPGARRWNGLKSMAEKRRARDEEYVPKKRSSTGSGRKDSRKDSKKDKSRRSGGIAANDAAVHPAMLNANVKDVKVKKEEPGGVARGGNDARSSTNNNEMVMLDPANKMDKLLIDMRREYMDFMTFLTTDEAKKRLLEQYHMENLRNQELTQRIQQIASTVETLLNTGVQTLNCRLHELEMTDVASPADILNRSKQIVTAHKDVTLQVSAMESQVLALERTIRTTVPYGQAIIEKLDAADFSLDDPYGVVISQACAETASELENDLPSVNPSDHILSPTGAGATPATRRPRPRPRTSAASRRSGGAAAVAAAAAAAAAAPTAGAPAMPGGAVVKPDNEEVERQIAEIVQKALLVDSVAKEKEKVRARGAGAAMLGGGPGDRKRSGGGGGGASAASVAPLPATPVTTAAGAYAALSAAELLRFQLPSFDHSMDYQHHQQH